MGEREKEKWIIYGILGKEGEIKKETDWFGREKWVAARATQLNSLRAFRDTYIKNLPNGEEILREYYRIAPRIIAHIDQGENPKKTYLDLYVQLVLKTVTLINLGKKVEAFENCYKIVSELKKKYLGC
ncbi:MAG: hypothetical protein ACUVTD_05675 [Nitrososphaerales archaeon]